jgi:predicted aminopeptidase
MGVLGMLGSLISGCSPLYVIRAAYEEGKILWRREPITAYLAKPDLGADTEDKLKLVLAVREYASDVLKLNVGGSYSSYSYVDRPDLTYLLTAAPRTEPPMRPPTITMRSPGVNCHEPGTRSTALKTTSSCDPFER